MIGHNDVFSDNPPAKIFFQVFLKYEGDSPLVAGFSDEDRWLDSEPVRTYIIAHDVAEELARITVKEFANAKIVQISPDDMETQDQSEEDVWFLILDENDRQIASIGITGFDYRQETIH